MGIALLAEAGKSSIVVREKCLTHKSLSAHSCSASNPGVTAPEKIQIACHCSVAACGTYAVPNVMPTCRSGYVHANKCGACVRCAKDLDEACGGHSDFVGTCRSGLVCEIPEAGVKDEQGGEGKCVVDASEQKKPGRVYRSPKATFSIADLLNACQNKTGSVGNMTSDVPDPKIGATKDYMEEGEEKKEKVDKGQKGLRTLSTKRRKKLKKLTSVERGWREIFSDPDFSEAQSDSLVPVSGVQILHPVLVEQVVHVPDVVPKKVFRAHNPVYSRPSKFRPLVFFQPQRRGW